ncbi:hypothetical protein CY34DRAFT_641904 [Suillus luteus UH-Slu-Lm8-n1]|uniref:Uncharacterized protein n=1 Tax=Suillus luteus UH-Slu-Lm8-n1 TaxID=930992 RepID=A0A0D0BDM3_9AGAM|nr:hypothetical protein CY34DRAFT_641904 [Suillus luteus UH-Slu-Lm8-n1]
MTCVRERYATSWVSALQNRSTFAPKCLVICPKYVGRVCILQVHFKPSAEALIISIQARFQLVSLFYYSAPHLPFGVYQYCFCVISCVKPMISSQSFGGGPYRSPCGMLPKSRITSAGCLTGAMMENQVNNGVIRTGKCSRRSTKGLVASCSRTVSCKLQYHVFDLVPKTIII